MLSKNTSRLNNLTALADLINDFRIFPRIFIGSYIFLLIHSVFWYQNLPTPSTEQSAFVSVIIGVGMGWFNSYVNTKK